MPTQADELRVLKAKRDIREMYAEVCYYYPQYKLEDLIDDENIVPIGDIELLLNVAKKLYYQSKLDDLHVATAAQSKKGYKAVKGNLESLIKKIRARI